MASLSPLLSSDPATAAREALRLLSHARQNAAHEQIGRLAYAAAQARSREGRNTEALGLIAEAQQAHRAAGNTVEAVRVALGRMSVLNEIGRHHDALSEATAAQAELSGMRLVADDRWLHAAFEKNAGLTLGFLGRHHEALTAYERAATQFDELGLEDELPAIWHNQAVETLVLGRPADALEGFRRAARGHSRAGDAVAATESRRDAANALLHLGRFDAALQVLQTARTTFEGLGMRPEVARTVLSIGEANLLLGQLDEAEDALREAGDEFEVLGMPHDQAVALLLRGRALGRQGQRAEAIDVLGRAAGLADACDDTALWCSSQLALAEADADSAMQHLEAAIRRVDADRWPVHAALIHAHAVHTFLDAGDLPRANHHVLHARMAGVTATRTDVARVLDHAAGRIGLVDGRLAQAIADLRRAAASLDHDTIDLTDPIARLGYLDGQADPHDDLVVAHRRAGDDTAALDVLEQRKARVLTSQLRAHRGVRDPAEDQRIAPAGLAEGVSGRDLGDSILVSWQVHRGQLAGHVTDGKTTRTVELGSADPVLVAMSQLEAQWVRLRGQSAHAERFAERLAATADHLLAGLDARLVAPLDIPSGRPLIISPDGPIAHVPFSALGGRDAPLLDRHALSVVASGLLVEHHDARVDPGAGTLLVGPTPDGLPGTREEIAAVAGQHDGATVLLGAGATADAVSARLADACLVHLACHGRFRGDAPFASEVQMADRWVTATEMMRWDWQDRVVVLSACAVGRSAALGGERAGMARALLGAGARAVVVAKWDIPDASTASLLSDVHAGLAEGRPVRDALRHAQLAAASRSAHPVAWAAFEVIHR